MDKFNYTDWVDKAMTTFLWILVCAGGLLVIGIGLTILAHGILAMRQALS